MGKTIHDIGKVVTFGTLLGPKLFPGHGPGPAAHAPDIASVLSNRPVRTPFGGGDLSGTFLGNIGTPQGRGKSLLG